MRAGAAAQRRGTVESGGRGHRATDQVIFDNHLSLERYLGPADATGEQTAQRRLLDRTRVEC
jgi:hypothetical protein